MARRLLPLLGTAALAACSYDWTAGGSHTLIEAGLDAAIDAPADVRTDVAVPAEASPLDAAMPPVDSSVMDSRPVEASPPDCMQLEASIVAAKPGALACMPVASACMTTVTDECGCNVVVQAGSNAQAYVNAIAAFKGAGCSTTGLCGTCPAPVEGQCIVVDATAPAYACMQ
jgi:hypothetical protein